MMKIICIVVFCLYFGVSFATAQFNEAEVAGKRSEMKKLEQLVGQWKGSGWSQQGKERVSFVGTETVQRKIDGLALLVEGRFTAKMPGGEEKVIHETLAVLSYNPQTKIYDFNTFLASGAVGKHELKIVEDGWEWGFKIPQGVIRYKIKIADNTWTEIGEIMMNGKDWTKFFEMNLKKVS